MSNCIALIHTYMHTHILWAHLIDNLYCVLEDGQERWETKVSHLLHHWVRIYLETPVCMMSYYVTIE